MQKKTLKRSIFICLGFEKAAEFLIRKGPDVNIVGQGGNTALTWAAFKGESFTYFQFNKYFPIKNTKTITKKFI